MPGLEQFFAWVADPNIAFILGALGLACLYIEFTHPGLIAPGVVGAAAIVLAMYAFNLLPINSLGVLLILVGIGLLALEVKVMSHGVLAGGGILALVLGALASGKFPLATGAAFTSPPRSASPCRWASSSSFSCALPSRRRGARR